MKRFSLRHRLTFILLGLTVVIWIASVLVAASYTRRWMAKQIDLHLERYADMVEHTIDAILADPATESYFRGRAIRETDQGILRVKSFGGRAGSEDSAINLWFGRSQILVGTHSPALPRLATEDVVTNTLPDGSQWRTLYRDSASADISLAVAINLSSAKQVAVATSTRVLFPALIILPATVGILLFGIGRGLRPLDELALQISARRPNVLEPFDLANAPTELVSVFVSLNDLLDRLRRALTSEHRFTSNAAHELQTPLAAIQAAVQTAHAQLEHRVECRDVQQLLQRVSVRVTEASGTVSQLLTLARLDPEQEFKGEPIDLTYLITEIMAEVGGIASARNLAVRFNHQGKVVLNGHVEWLKILLRNLCINAFKYATPSSEVDVLIESRAEHVVLALANDCEHIPEEDFHRLTERFYYPNSADHGVGLGLSIVERIVELQGAELHLGNWHYDRGFRVEIRFPNGTPVA
jgi:signal transduction histidine kinase